MKVVAIIIAWWIGSRMWQDIPKQFLNVWEKPVIIYTMEAFQKHPNIDSIIVVCIDGWHEILKSYAKQFWITKLISIVSWWSCGQESIKHGIIKAKKLFGDDSMVLIHDAIRPMVSQEIISDNIAKCKLYWNATAVVPVTTVVLKKSKELYSEEIVDRDKLYLTQTPQAFILKDILSAHEEAEKQWIMNSVASCSLFVQLNRKIYYSIWEEINIKLTRPWDIQIFKALLNVKVSNWMK